MSKAKNILGAGEYIFMVDARWNEGTKEKRILVSASSPSPMKLNVIPLKQGIESLKKACGNHA